MKQLIGFLGCLLLCSNGAFGQQSESILIPYLPFELLRAEEDYSFLRQVDTDRRLYDKLKYVPVCDSSYVSFGADIRSEFQTLRSEDWERGKNDAALFQRFMLHSDWHFGSSLRLFAQLKSGVVLGRDGGPSPLNRDDLDFHQLFIGIDFGGSFIEVGRRELWYGSRRLISIREGTNVRQSFDGIRWIRKTDRQRLDVLLYAHTPQKIGVFDNGVSLDKLLWGAYWTGQFPSSTSTNFDLYYLGVHNENSIFEEGEQEETRHTLGLRHWAEGESLSFNNEVAGQFGHYGGGDVSAWTLSTEVYYRFSRPWRPRIGMKIDIISGDKRPADGSLQTFNPLYPRGGYFGLLSLIGPANLIDVHPSLELEVFENYQLNFDWDFFWRYSLADGIYFPSGSLNLPGNSSSERFIGHQLGFRLSRAFNRHLEVEASYFLFSPGSFITDISQGRSLSQYGISVGYKL